MPKIILIEPKASNLHIYSQYKLPRLGLFILGTLMKNRGWEVEIFYEEARQIDFSMTSDADLVGISTITSTAPRAYMVADKIRKAGVPVIMGGAHVTFMIEEALEHADFVIRGEGEIALMAFVDAWEKGDDFKNIPNLSYKKEGKPIHNPKGPAITELDQLPFPDFKLLNFNHNQIAGHTTIPVQTSRGCPFNCSFCSVTGMFGRKYRFRSTQNIIEELRIYSNKKNHIFFYDDNFAANHKRLKTLLTAMIREKFKFTWSTQVRADIYKNRELVKLMHKAGCRVLYIGLESVNPRSLKAIEKKQTVAEIKTAVKVIQRNGIHIHGMFIYGFDDDDWSTVKKTVKFATHAGLTSTQFLILTPLPGSKFYNKMTSEKRLLFKDWTLYDAHHVVFKPAKFTLSALQKAQMLSHKKFYSWKQSLKKLFQFKLFDLSIAHYARKLNRLWKQRNRTFLKAVDLLTSKKNAKIKIEFKQNINIDS